ncbi:unnamed protein product [Linum trigynum]|uniref:Uncharacterized protein n=1 Tax=Linum trigynum TaxID=586398 RepID=A0AAV2FRC0_9ROSI
MAWEKLAAHRHDGGLGNRNFHIWNKACVLRHVSDVLTSGGSLWVTWVQRYWLKQNSFLDLSPTSAVTCFWKKMLKCRGIAFPYISGVAHDLLWNGEAMVRYSVSKVWDTIRLKKPEVN